MTTTRQHFVPRFYLKHFANNKGKLQAYRQANGAQFTTTPDDICVKNSLYEPKQLRLANNNYALKGLTNTIENELAADESKLAPLYEAFVDCCERHDFKTKQFKNGRLAVCALASKLIVRHPCMLQQERSKTSTIAESLLANDEIANIARNDLEQEKIKEGFEAISEVAIMQSLLFSKDPNVPANRIYHAFAQKKMVIAEAPAEMDLITASMPLNLIEVDNDSYDFQAAIMPLTSKFVAVFTRDKEVVSFSKLSISEAVDFNMLLLANDIWDTAISRSRHSLMTAVNKWLTSEPGRLKR